MSPKQAADSWGVSLRTVMTWIKSAKIEFVQPAGPRGRILIPR
jgi:excisionase family DNA binding protein